MNSGFILSVVAGACASLASVNSKLALEEGGKTLRYVVPCSRLRDLHCTYLLVLLRCACIVAMLFLNGLMWNIFVKALGLSRSTVEATVVNMAANFLCTAVFGKLLFGEALALLWWLGASFIIFGMVFLNYSSSEYDDVVFRKQD